MDTRMIRRLHIQWLALGFSVVTLACSEDVTDVEQVEVAVVETNRGTFEMKFYPESAPLAVENFKTHAANGYYDGVSFHRIIPGFVIQGGDPTGSGSGGESIWGPPLRNEIDPNLRYDRRGRVGMANRGPDTNGSQFFITLGPTPWLDGKHTIFGEIISGMDTIDRIEKIGTPSGEPPLKATMNRIYFRTIPQP
jgi:cyclophilin family peptidyl-prolyl cis-trans isomerase